MSLLKAHYEESSSTLVGMSSQQQILPDDDDSDVRRRRLRSLRNGLALCRSAKSALIVLLTPLTLSPLLFSSNTEYRCAFSVLVMAAYWMSEVMPLAATAMLPVVLFPLTGIMSAKSVAREFLNDTNFLFIGGLIVAVAVEKCQLHERLALSVLHLVGSKPKWIMLGFMCVTAILSMFISNTATTAMMVPIAQSVTQQLLNSYRMHGKSSGVRGELLESGLEMAKPTAAESRMAKGLAISICFAANIGGIGTITGTPPNLVLVGMLSTLYPDADTEVHYLSWIAFAFPLMVMCLFACFFILLLVFLRNAPPSDDAVTQMMKERYEKLPRMRHVEKHLKHLTLKV
ncbi:NAC-3 protein [Aphelenchoides avenae]|nr:NAC-3 protein [Aphelenchus avenae]